MSLSINNGRKGRAAAWTAAGIMLAVLICCTSSSGPEDFEAYIVANNNTGISLDIFMDGTYQFTVAHQESLRIENVPQGTHLLEAYQAGTSTLIFSGEIEVQTSGNYMWMLEGPSTIKVTNEYGEKLQITLDGNVLGEIDDLSSQTIDKVTVGLHSLTAAQVSDGTTVATASIDVDEVKEYTWLIRSPD
jgi:hypothetical protein